MHQNNNNHKIIITKEVSKKILKQILSDYKNIEVFLEIEMLEDIPSKLYIPEHEILSQDEKDELLQKFNENSLSHIYINDMMSRYYNAKIGDILKITRPSFTAGKNIFYRKVIMGNFI